jgi:hypothetical protein
MTGSGLEEDLPIHGSLILSFTGCGCTYYHTTPHHIPLDTNRNTPTKKICQEKVLDARGDGEILMMVQKDCIEGNCRMHDIEIVLSSSSMK